jgi:hypothetical protein
MEEESISLSLSLSRCPFNHNPNVWGSKKENCTVKNTETLKITDFCAPGKK